MSTAQADPVSDDASHGEHGHDHDHPSFLAHHFDTPEQQFDSGKLGIWLFLVTEVLFFSGMFVAYAIFRNLRPDVFEGSSQFLNTKLGAINTGVLLFSSLTMAWAVRCSQTEEHKKLAAMLATTLSCAMVFLGVKSIEYSHKWGMGLLPAGSFFYDPANPHPTISQVESMGFSHNVAFFPSPQSVLSVCSVPAGVDRSRRMVGLVDRQRKQVSSCLCDATDRGLPKFFHGCWPGNVPGKWWLGRARCWA